jgi:hypothetical protein
MPASIAGGAGARPDHTISKHCAVLYRQSRSRLRWGGLVGAYSSRKASDMATTQQHFLLLALRQGRSACLKRANTEVLSSHVRD